MIHADGLQAGGRPLPMTRREGHDRFGPPSPIRGPAARAGAGRYLGVAVMLWGICGPALGQTLAHIEAQPVTEDLAPVVGALLAAIEALSDYRATGPLPPIFLLPQARIEQKVCDAPCNVRAAYLPREGIFLSAHLDPVRNPLDRSALLHELVHYLQQNHAKFEQMEGCERERSKEQEAYAIQNAYLASIGTRERVVFYDDFDCEGARRTSPQ